MLLVRAHRAVDELPVDARAHAHCGPVRADDDVLAVRDVAHLGVVGRELDLGVGPLELELLDALDDRAREERAIAQELERASVCGRRRRRVSDTAIGPLAVRSGSSPSASCRACGSIVRPKRSPSFASHATSSGAGGITVRRTRCARPSRLTIVPSRSR